MQIRVISFCKEENEGMYCNMILKNNAFLFSTTRNIGYSLKQYSKFDHTKHNIITILKDDDSIFFLENININKKILKIILSDDREIRILGLGLLYNELKVINDAL